MESLNLRTIKPDAFSEFTIQINPFTLHVRRLVRCFVYIKRTFFKYYIYINAIVQILTTIVETLTRFHLAQFYSVGDMNSFNHYAYGAVAGWVYGVAVGIKPAEAGFAKVLVEPHPDERLGFLEASVDTRHGKVVSKWVYKDDKPEYEITASVGYCNRRNHTQRFKGFIYVLKVKATSKY